jgi:hypothetical protein
MTVVGRCYQKLGREASTMQTRGCAHRDEIDQLAAIFALTG